MKFFSWMHKKLNSGGQANTKLNQQLPTAVDGGKEQEQYNCHEQGHLLSIGTLGNHGITEKHTEEEDEDLSDFTPLEVGQLQKELRKLLRKKEPVAASADLPLDRFLNCPSSLEVDRRISNMSRSSSILEVDRRISNTSCCCSVVQDLEEEAIIDQTIRVIIDRCKTVCRERKRDQKLRIGKKSISFLFNKMFFVCGNAFNPSPPTSMRDSRMEKLLRTMLSKKFNHPQSSTLMKNKHLEDIKSSSSSSSSSRTRKESELDETHEKKNGHQWVKTDSEYIVLEI